MTTQTEAAPKPETRPERKPLLAVTTLDPERPEFTINDDVYKYRLMQDFGAIEHQQFTRRSGEYDELWGSEKLNRAQGRRMEELLDWLFDHVIADGGAKLLRERLGKELTGAIKREIVLTFTNAPLLMAVMAQQTETTPGEKPSTTGS